MLDVAYNHQYVLNYVRISITITHLPIFNSFFFLFLFLFLLLSLHCSVVCESECECESGYFVCYMCECVCMAEESVFKILLWTCWGWCMCFFNIITFFFFNLLRASIHS